MPCLYLGFFPNGVNLSSRRILEFFFGGFLFGPRIGNQLEMSSPVTILVAGISTVPISSAPKMSLSLTWNFKLITGCASGM